MSDDLRDLYQEVILEHARKPRNFRKIEVAGARKAEGFNRLCGDHLWVHLLMENGKIQDISFEGSGCAISTASASMMTQSLKGREAAEAEALFERFHHLVTVGDDGASVAPDVDLGKLEIFAGVRRFPVRVKCAMLAWRTLEAALEQTAEPITTE